jgi:RNA polymerase sigma-70 factor (ECF subfamily)
MDAQALEHPVTDARLEARFASLLEQYRAPIARLAAAYERHRALTHGARRRPPAADLDEALDVPDPHAVTERNAQAREERERLLSAVRSLSPLHREVVLLTLEGLPQREIAEVLGITAVNVAVRLSRARSELTRRLGERP